MIDSWKWYPNNTTIAVISRIILLNCLTLTKEIIEEKIQGMNTLLTLVGDHALYLRCHYFLFPLFLAKAIHSSVCYCAAFYSCYRWLEIKRRSLFYLKTFR